MGWTTVTTVESSSTIRMLLSDSACCGDIPDPSSGDLVRRRQFYLPINAKSKIISRGLDRGSVQAVELFPQLPKKLGQALLLRPAEQLRGLRLCGRNGPQGGSHKPAVGSFETSGDNAGQRSRPICRRHNNQRFTIMRHSGQHPERLPPWQSPLHPQCCPPSSQRPPPPPRLP